MKQKHNKSKKKSPALWLITILLLAMTLSLAFSILSELILQDAVVIVAVFVILIFIAISILFDMLGLAVASSNIEHFTAMAARKVKGAKQAMAMVKNADRVSSICNDVIGDVCGILAGAAGASILAKIALTSGSFMEILVPSIVSALIAGLTIFGKAALKRYAIKHANEITFKFAKLINVFTRKG